MHDCLIIGGGVVGLSLAWELARGGMAVRLIDQGLPGQEASWAGAGILPPASRSAALHPYDRLRALSSDLHPEWAERLQVDTGIDNGYRRCGGIYLARTAGEAASLAAWAHTTLAEGIAVELLTAVELEQCEPDLAPRVGRSGQRVGFQSAVRLPDEAQIRNPRHLQALLAACQNAGVGISAHVAATDFIHRGERLEAVETTAGRLRAKSYCFTSGAWTGQLLARLGIAAAILPIRGQMVLFQCEKPPLTHIINEGSRYIVPREDGFVLAGATEEEVGFDKRTTGDAIDDLVDFALALVPALYDAPVVRTWAGLRPATLDGMPYMGPLPGLANAFIAAGHFRSGLYLSPGTAVVMSQLIRGEQPAIDLTPFRIGR